MKVGVAAMHTYTYTHTLDEEHGISVFTRTEQKISSQPLHYY